LGLMQLCSQPDITGRQFCAFLHGLGRQLPVVTGGNRPFSAVHPGRFQAEVRGTTALDEIQSRSLSVQCLKRGCLRAPDPIQNRESAETPSLINEAQSCKPVSVE
ncbi:hypothetical protein, partial [Burkholderia ubonensis]|uniref:hypothetical protein n=1 Tax=Burkholderia ubonensis TaxID=101571 RepID=UPI001C8A9E33